MIQIEGIEEVRSALNNAIAKNKELNRKTIQDICLHIKGESQQRAPVDQGDLRSSGYYRTSEKKDGISAEVGFNAPYALKQHEELHYNHPKGGQAKYLESVLVENVGKYIQDIANSTKEAFE